MIESSPGSIVPTGRENRESTNPARGRWLLLTAAVLWSLSGVLVKSPPLRNVPAVVIACERAGWACLGLLVFVRPAMLRWRVGLFPMITCFATMNWLFILAMTRTTAAATIFLQYTSTAWAFLFGALFLHERIERRSGWALICCLAGILWIMVDAWNSADFSGNAIALCSGLMYSGVIIMLRWLREESSIWLVFLNQLASGLILLPAASASWGEWGMEQHLLLAFLGLVQMALPYVLFARGLQRATAQEAALLTLLEPILNPLWTCLFWGEAVPRAVWIGGAFILCGLGVRAIYPDRGRAEADAR